MSADVISHQAPHRKRANAGSTILRRTGVVMVALIGIIVSSLIALTPERVARTSAPARVPPVVQAVRPAPTPTTQVNAATDLAGAPPPRRSERRAPRHAGVPLDATSAAEPAGYEILSAAELEGISQARE